MDSSPTHKDTQMQSRLYKQETNANRFVTFHKKVIKGNLHKQINRLPLWAI